MASFVAPGNHRKELTAESHTVGAAPPADIIVHASMGVAPLHYRVSRTPAGWQLEHLAGNGTTTVNGLPTSGPTILNHGDQVAAGQLVLVFDDPTATPEAAPAAVVPSEAPTGLAAVVARAEAVAAEKDAKGKRFPKPAIIGAAAVLILGIGGLAAWKFGLFSKDEPTGANSALATSKASPTDGSHFDVVSRFGPRASNVAFTIDGKSVFHLYRKWQPTLANWLPPLEELQANIAQTASIKLTSLERVSLVGDMEAMTDTNRRDIPDGLLVVCTFAKGTNTKALVENIGLTPKGAEGPQFYTLDAGGTDRGTARTLGDRHLLLGSLSTLKQAAGAPRPKALVQSLLSKGGTLGLAMELDKRMMTRLGVEATPEQPVPKQIAASIDLAKGIIVNMDLTYAEEAHAKLAHQAATTMLQKLADTLQGTPQDKLATALIARIENEIDGNQQSVSMRVTDGEIRMVINEAKGAAVARAQDHKERYNAQNLASVFSTALAAGSPQLADVEDKESAVALLIQGVVGSKEAGFENSSFQVPAMSEADLAAALQHLQWNETGVLEYAPIDSTDSGSLDPKKAAKAFLAAMMKPSQGSNTQLDESKAIRNAQNMVSVYSASRAAGTAEFEGLDNAEAVARKLIEGVKGGEGTGFESTNFIVPIEEADLLKALQHISWDDATKGIRFAPKRTHPRRVTTASAKRDAQNIASVFASATAAQSEALSEVNGVETAISLLCQGVYGGKESGFDTVLFKVGDLGDAERAAASEYLAWDATARTLNYQNK